MELVIYGLVFVALIAIVILFVKHIFLMCSRIVAAAWHAAILFLIFLPILAITGHINISIEESTISVICGQVESLCPEPRPTLEEALIHMIEVHEANEATHRPGFQEENATTAEPNVDPILVGADI